MESRSADEFSSAFHAIKQKGSAHKPTKNPAAKIIAGFMNRLSFIKEGRLLNALFCLAVLVPPRSHPAKDAPLFPQPFETLPSQLSPRKFFGQIPPSSLRNRSVVLSNRQSDNTNPPLPQPPAQSVMARQNA